MSAFRPHLRLGVLVIALALTSAWALSGFREPAPALPGHHPMTSSEMFGESPPRVVPSTLPSAVVDGPAPRRSGPVPADPLPTPRGERVSPAEKGWSHLQAGEYRKAVQFFTDASRWAPDDAALLVGLAIGQSHLSQTDAAIAALMRALEIDADVDRAHALLGQFHFIRDDLKAAIRHYETALRQDPNAVATQDALAILREAARAEAGLHRLFGPHFVVKFEPRDRRLADDVLARFERVYVKVGHKLGDPGRDPTIVILYSERRFSEIIGGSRWTSALFDGRIHLARQTVATPSGAESALAHEYIHALVHRVSDGHAPTWVTEGLALSFEGRPAAWDRPTLTRHRQDLAPLHALHGSFLTLSAPEAAVAYAESYRAVQTLLSRHGFARVRRLLETLVVTPDFATAFERVFHEAYRDFQMTWNTAQGGRRA